MLVPRKKLAKNLKKMETNLIELNCNDKKEGQNCPSSLTRIFERTMANVFGGFTEKVF